MKRNLSPLGLFNSVKPSADILSENALICLKIPNLGVGEHLLTLKKNIENTNRNKRTTSLCGGEGGGEKHTK